MNLPLTQLNAARLHVFKMAVARSLAEEGKPLLSALRLARSYHNSTCYFSQHSSMFLSRQSRYASLFIRRNIWSSRQDDLTRALSDAEKIVGYPTSFLNLRYLLSDEISNIAMYMKRFAMSKHPMLRTARGFVSDENHTVQTRGLLVLLISKASRPCLKTDWNTEQDLVADIHSSQRQLADITETIHTGNMVTQILCIMFHCFCLLVCLLLLVNQGYFRSNASVNSICTHPPPPPGNPGAFAQVLCFPGAGQLCTLGATPPPPPGI